MLAFRQILTFSTSSVVIFGFGGLAIAQDSPATPSPQSVALLPNIGVLSQQSVPVVENVVVPSTAVQPSGLMQTERRSPDTLTTFPNEGAITAANLTPKPVVENKSNQIVESVVLPLPIPHVGSLVANKSDVAEMPVTRSKPKQSFVFAASMSPETATQVEQNPAPALAQREDILPIIEADPPEEDVTDEDSTDEDIVDEDMTEEDMADEDITGEEILEEETAEEDIAEEDLVEEEKITPETQPAIVVPVPMQEVMPAAIPVNVTPSQMIAAPASPPQINEIPPDLRVNQDLQTLLEPISNDDVDVPFLTEEVSATQELPLTLKETINIAIEQNQTLQEARLNLQRAEYQRQEAIAAKHPTLTNRSSVINSETTGGELSAEAAGVDEPFPSIAIANTIELSYDVYTGGSRPNQIDAADTQIEINELEVARITKEIRLTAATTYYDLQGADSQVAIEESAVTNAAQSLKDANLLEQAGLGTKFDVLRAQVELANAEQRLTRAYATRRTVRRRLAQVLSLEPTLDPRTADEISVAGYWRLSLEETIVLALQQREELRQQLLLREIDGYQREIALASIRPQVSVFANYDLLQVLEDDRNVADGFAFGARMQWNLFDGGAAQARARQEDVDQAIAENRFVDQRNQIRLAVETAFYDFAANERNIQTATIAVELADESLRLARLRFRAGVGTQTDVIAAQTQLTTARNNLSQTITDYNRAYATLKREVSVGEELEEYVPPVPIPNP